MCGHYRSVTLRSVFLPVQHPNNSTAESQRRFAEAETRDTKARVFFDATPNPARRSRVWLARRVGGRFEGGSNPPSERTIWVSFEVRRGRPPCFVQATEPEQRENENVLALLAEDATRKLAFPLPSEKERTARIVCQRSLCFDELGHFALQSFISQTPHCDCSSRAFAHGLLQCFVVFSVCA
jgi:hypothetical protein